MTDKERKEAVYKWGLYSVQKTPRDGQPQTFRLPCQAQCKSHNHEAEYTCIHLSPDKLNVAPPPRESDTAYIVNSFPSNDVTIRRVNQGRSFICLICAENIYQYLLRHPAPLYSLFAHRYLHTHAHGPLATVARKCIIGTHGVGVDEFDHLFIHCITEFPTHPWTTGISAATVDITTTPPSLVYNSRGAPLNTTEGQALFNQSFLDMFQFCRACPFKGQGKQTVGLLDLAEHMLSMDVGPEYEATYGLMWRAAKYVALQFRDQGLNTSLDQLAFLKDYFGENNDDGTDSEGPWGEYMGEEDRLLEGETFRC